MIGVKSNLEKAQGAIDRNEAALERSTRRLSEHDANRPAGDDADASFLWRRERRDLEDRVDADREALEFSRGALATAQAAEDDRARKARHAKLEREAEAGKKRVAEIATRSAQLAALLSEHAAHVTELDRYNQEERPSELPFIRDAEHRLRYRQPVDIETDYIYEDVWRDANGRKAFHVEERGFGRDGSDHVTIEGSLYKKTREVVGVSRSAQHVIGGMPERLTSLIRLVDMEGKPIWPTR